MLFNIIFLCTSNSLNYTLHGSGGGEVGTLSVKHIVIFTFIGFRLLPKKKISLFMAYYTQPHDTMIAYDNETNKAYAFLCLKRIQISFPSPSIAHIRIFVMNRTFVKMGISHHGLHQRASNKEFKAENLTPCLSTPFSIHL